MIAHGLRPGPSRPSAGKRTLGAAALAHLFGLILLLGMAAYVGPDARAASVNISLYGTTFGGWGTAPGTETNPGPTFTVDLGDRVIVALTSEDAPMGHAFWIDYDNDGVIDLASEPSSPEFTSTIVFMFDATVSGTFTYYCSIHSGPPYSPTASVMRGIWVTAGPPSIAIASPMATTSWSGGVSHDIVFTLGSADPPASLRVWVNYSYDAGAVTAPIVGPIPGGPNPIVVSWAPTEFSATDVTIDLTAVDSSGRKGIAVSPPFEVDSSAPTVSSTVPSSGSTGIPLSSQIVVAWSEGMNRAVTGSIASFGVARSADGIWISGTFGWSPDSMQMTFIPAAPLERVTTYRAQINGTAKDDSDPGNAVGAPVTWSFTTGQAVDAAPPLIGSAAANPGLATVGESVNLTAQVTDNVAVSGVHVHVVGPAFDMNLTMTKGEGTTWFASRAYTAKGTYTFTVWATDTSGNVVSRSGSFGVRDAPPSSALPDFTTVALIATAVAVPSLVGYLWWRRRSR